MRRVSRTVRFAILLLTGAAVLATPGHIHASPGNATISQTCAAGYSNASFAWDGSDPKALQQWLDLSLFDNGWQPHSFMSAGPLSALSSSYTWNGLPSRVPFFVRINQQLPDGSWDPSQTYRFTSMDCTAIASVQPPLSPPLTAPGATSAAPTPTATPASPSPTPTRSATSTSSGATGTFSLFQSARPPGFDTYRPGDAIGYYFTESGFDFETLKSKLTVSLVGPGGSVPTTLSSASGGWSWDVNVPGGITIWMSPAMPPSKYIVTVTLPDGRSASGGFFHYVQSA